jgi:hypothetical protein
MSSQSQGQLIGSDGSAHSRVPAVTARRGKASLAGSPTCCVAAGHQALKKASTGLSHVKEWFNLMPLHQNHLSIDAPHRQLLQDHHPG